MYFQKKRKIDMRRKIPRCRCHRCGRRRRATGVIMHFDGVFYDLCRQCTRKVKEDKSSGEPTIGWILCAILGI